MDDNKMKAPEEQSSVNEAADTSAEAAAAEEKVQADEKKPDLSRKDAKAALKKAKKEAKARKKEVKRLKKEYEARKKVIPLYKRTIICPPDKAASSTKTIVLGYICRAIILFFATFGIVFFAADGFGIINSDKTGVGGGWIALWSLVFTAIFTFTAVFPKRKIAVPAGIAAAAGITALMLLPDPVKTVYQAAINTFNTALGHLTDVGYYAMNEKTVNISLTAGSSDQLLKKALFIAVLFISAVYVFSLVRRIKPVPFIIAALVSAGILWGVFTYNISRSNWGVSLIIASFSSLLIMFAFDNMYIKAAKPDETDPDSGMFGIKDEPPLPESYLNRKKAATDKKAAKAEKKAARKAKKKASKKKEAPKVSVDEELTDYFSAPAKKARPKKEKAVKEKLTPEQKKQKAAEEKAAKEAEKARKKAENAAIALNKRFHAGILDAKCAGGGFAGAGMFLLCMVLLIIPTLSVSRSFHTVEAIDKKFDMVREYVTALLMGDDPTLDLLSYENDPSSFAPKTTDPSPIYFTGKKMMTVESNSRYNVYLRGWVATVYNDETGCWETARPDDEAFASYRRLFGTTVDPSETLMYNFYSLIDPSSLPQTDDFDFVKRTKSNTGYGFVMSQINMKRTDELDSKLLFMPSFSVRGFNVHSKTSGGKSADFLRAYGSAEASKITYADYFDGLYTSYRARKDDDGYAAVALITNQKVSGWYRTVAEMIANFNNSRAAIESGALPPADGDTVNGWYTLTLADGSKIQYRTEYRNSEGGRAGFTVDEAGVRHYTDSDGYVYVLTKTADTVGNNLYKLSEDGELLRKTVENVPEDKLLDENGEQIVYSAPSLPFAVRYFAVMTDAQQKTLTYDYSVLDYYTNFVYSTYTKQSSSQIIRDLANTVIQNAKEDVRQPYMEYDEETGEYYESYRTVQVKADFSKASKHVTYSTKIYNDGTPVHTLEKTVTDKEVYIQRHKLVMEFINYLTNEENYKYTLTPKASTQEGLVGVEKFLVDTKEGYCVQFATALVLMLRDAGIPARYVDGYVAANFGTNYETEKAATYISNVKDSNAHAWVEVWFDGVGWVQYEATPAYYNGMYETGSEERDPSYRPTGGDDEDPGEEGPKDEGLTDEQLAELIKQQQEEARRALIRKIFTIILCVVIGVAVLLLVFFYFWKRAKAAQNERDKLAARFAEADKAAPEDVPTRDDVRKFSDLITLMLDECGLSPKVGEFRYEYAKRLAEYNPGALAKAVEIEKLSEFERSRTVMHEEAVARMLDTMAAEEFGYGAEAADMPLMARFWRRMYAYEYSRHVNPVRRIWLWMFRRKI